MASNVKQIQYFQGRFVCVDQIRISPTTQCEVWTLDIVLSNEIPKPSGRLFVLSFEKQIVIRFARRWLENLHCVRFCVKAGSCGPFQSGVLPLLGMLHGSPDPTQIVNNCLCTNQHKMQAWKSSLDFTARRSVNPLPCTHIIRFFAAAGKFVCFPWGKNSELRVVLSFRDPLLFETLLSNKESANTEPDLH